MGPFYYPKARHRRGGDPGPYADYKKYKPALRSEFVRKCVYCRVPDLSNVHTFAVEHYRPKSDARFAHLSTSWPNLFYSCTLCNSYKGTYWPSDDHESEGVFVPNPCDHVMIAHLKFVGLDVQPQSAAGTFTKRLLRLDTDDRTKHRRLVWAAAKQFTRELADWDKTINDIEALIADGTGNSASLQQYLLAARTERDKVAADLADLGG